MKRIGLKKSVKNKYVFIIICILVVLVLIEILPYIVTIFFPKLCYGCTTIGKIHQYLNIKYSFAYINWIAYVILLLYVIYRHHLKII